MDMLRGWSAILSELVIVLLWAAPALAQTPASRPAVDPDLVGWWRGADASDGTAADLSGHNHPLRPSGSGKLTTRPVDGHVAFSFARDDAPLSGGTATEFDFAHDFTIACFVRFDRDCPSAVVLKKIEKNAPGGYAIVYEPADGLVFYGEDPVTMVASVRPAPLKWHHLAVTYSNSRFLFYIDGRAIAAANHEKFPGPNKAHLLLGGTNGTRALLGAMDDIRIYHRAMREDDIMLLATAVQDNPGMVSRPAS